MTIEMTTTHGVLGPPDSSSVIKLQRAGASESKGVGGVSTPEDYRAGSPSGPAGWKSQNQDGSKGKVSDEQLKNAVSDLNDYVQTVQRNLEFTVDKDTGIRIVKVVDTNSKEVIRQIPPEEVVNLAKRLEKSEGRLFSAKA